MAQVWRRGALDESFTQRRRLGRGSMEKYLSFGTMQKGKRNSTEDDHLLKPHAKIEYSQLKDQEQMCIWVSSWKCTRTEERGYHHRGVNYVRFFMTIHLWPLEAVGNMIAKLSLKTCRSDLMPKDTPLCLVKSGWLKQNDVKKMCTCLNSQTYKWNIVTISKVGLRRERLYHTDGHKIRLFFTLEKMRMTSFNGSDKIGSEIRQWYQQRCKFLEDHLLMDSVWLSDKSCLSQWNYGMNHDSGLWTNEDTLLGQVEMMGILSENSWLKLEFVMNQGVIPKISPGL